MMTFRSLLRSRSLQSYPALLLAGLPIGLALLLLSAPVQASFWASLFQSPPPDPPTPRGSRGPYFCAIAPYSSEMQVQGDRPRFIWQGVADRVEIREAEGDTPIWSAPVTDADAVNGTDLAFEKELLNSTIYQLTPPDLTLEPEQTYELRVFRAPFGHETVYFQTISTHQQSSVAEQVSSFTADPASDDRELIQRADYFAGQDLWPDFWHQVFLIREPSAELVNVLEAQLIEICRLEELD